MLKNSDYGNPKVFYEKFYLKLRGIETSGVGSFLWKYPHKLIEKSHKSNQGKTILEVGVGNGEHLNFVVQDYSRYVAIDILADSLNRISPREGLELIVADAVNLPFPDLTFDRTIATCLLAHLVDIEAALIEWRRVTKAGGVIQIYVPCEPGLGLRFFRKIFSQPTAKKLGFEGYSLFIARDHRNSTQNMNVFIREVFKMDAIRVKRRPFPMLGWYLNLFYLYEIKVSK